jgi:hypothetical protein
MVEARGFNPTSGGAVGERSQATMSAAAATTPKLILNDMGSSLDRDER